MTNYFSKIGSSRRSTAVHNIEQVPDQCKVEEDYIDVVDINLFIFNSKWLAITTNLKTSSNQVSVVISYKEDMGSCCNIMSLHLHKKYFLGTKEQLETTKNKNIQLKPTMKQQ